MAHEGVVVGSVIVYPRGRAGALSSEERDLLSHRLSGADINIRAFEIALHFLDSQIDTLNAEISDPTSRIGALRLLAIAKSQADQTRNWLEDWKRKRATLVSALEGKV